MVILSGLLIFIHSFNINIFSTCTSPFPYNESKTSGGDWYLKPSKLNIENQLLEIHGEIARLAVEENFQDSLLEDIELAAECFKEKTILSVLNCLTALIGKLQTHVILARCHYSVIENLLIRIHGLQQVLIKLPVCTYGDTEPAKPLGSPEPTRATEPAELSGTTTITTGSFSYSDLPIQKNASTKSGAIDYSSHTIIYFNPYRKMNFK